MVENLLFGKYTWNDVVVNDSGLKQYVNLNPIIAPHTHGVYGNKWRAKANMNIVERLINGMMRTEHATGEKARAYRLVKDTFDIVSKKTKKNPIQALVDAVQNAAPKEEITRLSYGGTSVPKAVDISPLRRLDVALRNLCLGAINASHGKKKRIEDCLADEIITACKNDTSCFAISKKDEIERIAASAR